MSEAGAFDEPAQGRHRGFRLRQGRRVLPRLMSSRERLCKTFCSPVCTSSREDEGFGVGGTRGVGGRGSPARRPQLAAQSWDLFKGPSPRPHRGFMPCARGGPGRQVAPMGPGAVAAGQWRSAGRGWAAGPAVSEAPEVLAGPDCVFAATADAAASDSHSAGWKKTLFCRHQAGAWLSERACDLRQELASRVETKIALGI